MATMYRGPFVGFLYGNGEKASDFVSSKTLKVVRVSDSDRYTENGFPEFEERTVQVPGRDETYYFGRDFTSKEIELSLAFDEITEEEFQTLKATFANKKPQKLIFDETPYKYYTVVASDAIEIQYLCFDTPSGERVYKGEATIEFVAYYPFARSIAKTPEELISFYKTESSDEETDNTDTTAEETSGTEVIDKESTNTSENDIALTAESNSEQNGENEETDTDNDEASTDSGENDEENNEEDTEEAIILFDEDDGLWYNNNMKDDKNIWKTQLPMDWTLTLNSFISGDSGVMTITFGDTEVIINSKCPSNKEIIIDSKSNILLVDGEVKNKYLSTPIIQKIETEELKINGEAPESGSYVLDYSYVYY